LQDSIYKLDATLEIDKVIEALQDLRIEYYNNRGSKNVV
jgi:hypothetical protein